MDSEVLVRLPGEPHEGPSESPVGVEPQHEVGLSLSPLGAHHFRQSTTIGERPIGHPGECCGEGGPTPEPELFTVGPATTSTHSKQSHHLAFEDRLGPLSICAKPLGQHVGDGQAHVGEWNLADHVWA